VVNRLRAPRVPTPALELELVPTSPTRLAYLADLAHLAYLHLADLAHIADLPHLAHLLAHFHFHFVAHT